MPVSVCVALISTPGNTAPDGSLTVPLISAVACAQTCVDKRFKAIKKLKKTNVNRLIIPPLARRQRRGNVLTHVRLPAQQVFERNFRENQIHSILEGAPQRPNRTIDGMSAKRVEAGELVAKTRFEQA